MIRRLNRFRAASALSAQVLLKAVLLSVFILGVLVVRRHGLAVLPVGPETAGPSNPAVFTSNRSGNFADTPPAARTTTPATTTTSTTTTTVRPRPVSAPLQHKYAITQDPLTPECRLPLPSAPVPESDPELVQQWRRRPAREFAAEVRACVDSLPLPTLQWRPAHLRKSRRRVGLLNGAGRMLWTPTHSNSSESLSRVDQSESSVWRLPDTTLQRLTPRGKCPPSKKNRRTILQCDDDPGWLGLPSPLESLSTEQVRECLSGRHIVFIGNSITRYMAWALVDLASAYGLRRGWPEPEKRILWGSHQGFFTSATSLGESNLTNGVRLYFHKFDKHRDNSFWSMPGLGLNVTFGHIYDFGGQEPTHTNFTRLSEEDFGTRPSLVVMSMGLRVITKASLRSHRADVQKWIETHRRAFPDVPILYQLMGSSHDELRGGYATTQGQADIAAHSIEAAQGAVQAGAGVLDIMELGATELAREATFDGIHFLEGTGVNEALVSLLLHTLC